MTEETITILVRAKILYDETKTGAREYVANGAAHWVANGGGRMSGAHVSYGGYDVQFEPDGELLSDQPTPPPDITLCPRLAETAQFLRNIEGKVEAADLMDEAREAIANASGVQCDIAEYHLGRLFKIWARLDQLAEALKKVAPDTLREIENNWKKEQTSGE